jgi:tetratricopeptide (TPR) repeat protein
VLQEKFRYAPSAPEIYQRILKLDPEDLVARSALCECYYRQGKYEQAIAEGEKGLQYSRYHPELLTILAKTHYERGEYGRVVTYCREVLTKRPGHVDTQILLAVVYARNMLTTNDAIKNYRAALQCEPQNFIIRLALFRSYLRKLQVDMAISECEQILTTLYDIYATSSREFRSYIKEMITEYEKAIRRSPGDMTLYLVTARLYEHIGHFHKALIYYRTLLELPLENPMIHKLIELLEKLTTFQVQNPHLYLYLGLLYHKIQHYDDAKRAFRVAMYSELEEHEVDDILVRHDRSIWRYPPVLVILAHHRIVTKDILEGLVQTFRQSDREDWEGVLWVLQELYDIDDLLLELRQTFEWDHFTEIYHQILPLFAQNGSPYAVQFLKELLAHHNEDIRLEALSMLIQMEQPLAEQHLVEVSRENPYPDIRLELANYYMQQPTEQSTYYLLNMLHDEEPEIRLFVAQALQHRDIQSDNLREVLFTEQNAEVKVEIVKLFERLHQPEESIYLAHLLDDLVTKRHAESEHVTSKVYSRIKKLISHSEKPEEIQLLSVLIETIGNLRLEQGIYTLIALAGNDRSHQLRLESIEALGKIGSPLGMAPLQEILHSSSELQDIRSAAEQALEQIVQQKASN